MRCATCKHWTPRKEYETGHAQGLGACEAVPMFWDMTEWSDDDDSDDRVFKAEAAGITAFAQDGSDYKAYLLTRPEHGCTMYVSATLPSEAESLADGFDGSTVRPGPNHSTIEIWYDTEAQARAAHSLIRDLIDAAPSSTQQGEGE